jgi:hypothetical protein
VNQVRGQLQGDQTDWRNYLTGLQQQKQGATGVEYQVVDNGPGKGGIRPADGDPKTPGVQPVPTLAGAQAVAKAANTPPKTISTPAGTLEWDPRAGKFVQLTGPKATASPAAKPFSLSPGQVEYVPDGKGGYTPVQGPDKPAPTVKPIVVGSASTGWNIVDPSTGKTIASMPGAAQKPTVTGSATTGWTARDASGNVVWTQKGAPPASAKIVPSSLAPTSKNLVDTSGKVLGGNPNYTGPKPPTAASMKQGLAAWATSGGIDWTNRYASPQFRAGMRAYITQTTGKDPGVLPARMTPADLASVQKFLGVTPPSKTSAKPRVTGTGPGSKYEIDPTTGKPVRGNPNYVPPSAKADKPTSPSEQGKQAEQEGNAEKFAATVYGGGTLPDGSTVGPLTYTEALTRLPALEALGVPRPIAVKALKAYYAHGNKQIHDLVTDPNAEFTLTGNGSVAVLQNHKVVRTIKPGQPGYTIAKQRAGAK